MSAYHLLLAVHLVLAVFAIGPLVHGATTAGRGVRTGDGAAVASSARMLRIYSYVSVLVVIAGFALMSLDSPYRKGEKVGEFSDVWIWLSLLLWALAAGIVLGLVVPTLEKAKTTIDGEGSVVSLTGRVAAGGGVVAILFLVIVVLMVYRPGS
ncbi:hypothetical protein [Jatrophihabitans fulvus]